MADAEDRPSGDVVTLYPELEERSDKVAPDYYDRLVDELIRMADKLEQPLMIIAPSADCDPTYRASQSAMENYAWMIGAMECVKIGILTPEYIVTDENGEQTATETPDPA